jgi:hypothetical protein
MQFVCVRNSAFALASRKAKYVFSRAISSEREHKSTNVSLRCAYLLRVAVMAGEAFFTVNKRVDVGTAFI